MQKTHILFICSRNKWRSPTAESIFKNHGSYDARSAGTKDGARVKVNSKLIAWADLIFVMEKKHKLRLIENFHDIIPGKKIITLNIPDDYQFMDPELIEILKTELSVYLDL